MVKMKDVGKMERRVGGLLHSKSVPDLEPSWFDGRWVACNPESKSRGPVAKARDVNIMTNNQNWQVMACRGYIERSRRKPMPFQA